MFSLAAAELRRTWTLQKRYPLDLVVGLIMMGVSFYALFLGAQYLAGPTTQFGDRLDSLIIGYGLWTLVVMSMNSVALLIQGEARTGTLEQIYLSSYGPLRVVLTRAGSILLVSVASSVLMLLLMLVVTGRHLQFPVATLLPLATVVVGAHGLGLALGALALVFKRVQEMMRLFQFSLLALVVLPVEQWDGVFGVVGMLLPVAPAAGQLRDLMARGTGFDLGFFGLVVANSVGHFVIGVGLFLWADRVARTRGLLGQY
jgi:ABC-2 type transport system permease protein